MKSNKRTKRLLAMRVWRLVLAVGVSLGFPGCGKSVPALLVENGQPRAEIVIAEQPARMTRLAASELQTYIQKISGAVLPIVTEPTGGTLRIYVGVSPHTEALGLETDGLKYGAYRMASGPDWLALLGPDKDFEPVEPWGRSRDAGETQRINRAWDEITKETFWNPFHSLFMWYNPELDFWEFDDRGTLHAVYAFLDDLGVRWYMPGELGEVVPGLRDIPLPAADATVNPDFPVRLLSWFQQHQPVSAEDALWRLRLRLHPGHDVIGKTQTVHGMKYVHRREEMKQAHPEFYAMLEGGRATGFSDSGAPCLSSKELFDKHVAYVRAVFDHFGEPMISIDLVDGFGGMQCSCPACSEQMTPERGAHGSSSDYVWGYLNRVAMALYESHPDRFVSGLTYGAYRLPPEKIDEMAPNLVMFMIPPRMDMHNPEMRSEHEAFRKAWLEKLPSNRIFVWSNILYNWQISPWWGVPVFFPHVIAEDLRAVKGISGGEIIECYEHVPGQEYGWNAQAVAHLALVAYSRLWWDADQDIDALLEEYYTLFYGPARDGMKAFIEYCEKNWPRMRREVEPIDQALALLAAAQEAAAPGSVYRQRIDLIAEYTQPLDALRAQLGRARVDVPQARILLGSALAGKELDGRLDDERYWPKVRTLNLTDLNTGAYPADELRSWTRVFWADNAIYIGVHCGEPDMAHLNKGRAPDGSNDVRSGDFVEILLETLTHSYYRISVGPSGVLMDADRSEGGVGEAWASNAEAAVHLGEKFWSAEVRIPLAGEGARLMDPRVGVDGRMPTQTYTWYFNVGRQRVRDGLVQRWAISPTGADDFEVPERFAELWGGADLR